jgi:hypothetical protein
LITVTCVDYYNDGYLCRCILIRRSDCTFPISSY